jgi:hypothetical protein
MAPRQDSNFDILRNLFHRQAAAQREPGEGAGEDLGFPEEALPEPGSAG